MKRFSSPLTYNFQSGIFDIDRFLDETKSKSNNNNSSTTISDNNNNNNKSSLKWIPYNEFSNIKEIGKGGFGVVYEAIWHDAPEQKIDLIWNKKRVALKVLRYSTNDDQSTDFLNELKLHYRCMDSGRVLPCYGISQEPQTNNYILVMQYASEGNLRNYLSTSFARFDWWKKVNMLRDIVIGLQSIHNEGLVHHDFHSAPEVLRGEKYTKAADIYSLGLRPKLMPGTPECYAQVMQKCWNADPLSRPTAEELFVMLKQFKEISNYRTQIGEAELIRFGVIENILSTKSHKSIHPEAIYSSRLLEFSDLPQPKNADPVSIPTPNAYRPVRRRANSVTFHNRRPNNKQTNRRSVQIQSVSSTFNERRHSRSFSSDEVAESMRRLSLSLGPSKDLNAINEELFED
ncbi:uncharacterized protein OCT59_006447 [Rhizophagus irregularis]|uniref:uncharacterized protein n=1 Tax=Rhizophagus irregularis TaxID=588596 RepID=UPI003333592F|nr:hypothetical protein OCT59_006447 [Rhizophagus irregularis]